MPQEALLPDTDAILRSTVEWTSYHSKQLVRYKDAQGIVHRCLTADYAEAETAFQKYVADLRKTANRP